MAPADFCFPRRDLSDDAAKLTPFEPAKHAGAYFQGSVNHPELYRFTSIGPFAAEQDFVSEFLDGFAAQSSVACFTVIDKKPPSVADSEGEVAGVISYMSASPVHLSAEAG